jgi:hypothetical protein
MRVLSGLNAPVNTVSDPMAVMQLNVDRLRCAAAVLSSLLRCVCVSQSGVVLNSILRSPLLRPVTIPIGRLVQLVQALLASTADGMVGLSSSTSIHKIDLRY